MTSYKFTYPSLALASPSALPGWLDPGKRRGIIEVIDVPDDVDASQVQLMLNNTMFIMTDMDRGGAFVFSFPEIGNGRIIRKTASLTDAVQERCIQAMQAMRLQPDGVATLVADHIDRKHAVAFLTRRASLGSHKLQHILRVLKLAIVDQ